MTNGVLSSCLSEGTLRQVRRSVYPTASLPGGGSVLWEWESDFGWLPYDLKTASILESAHKKKITSVNLSRTDLNIPNTVDLSQRQQINHHSCVSRRVRRTSLHRSYPQDNNGGSNSSSSLATQPSTGGSGQNPSLHGNSPISATSSSSPANSAFTTASASSPPGRPLSGDQLGATGTSSSQTSKKKKRIKKEHKNGNVMVIKSNVKSVIGKRYSQRELQKDLFHRSLSVVQLPVTSHVVWYSRCYLQGRSPTEAELVCFLLESRNPLSKFCSRVQAPSDEVRGWFLQIICVLPETESWGMTELEQHQKMESTIYCSIFFCICYLGMWYKKERPYFVSYRNAQYVLISCLPRQTLMMIQMVETRLMTSSSWTSADICSTVCVWQPCTTVAPRCVMLLSSWLLLFYSQVCLNYCMTCEHFQPYCML